jgi:hypothetical protein
LSGSNGKGRRGSDGLDSERPVRPRPHPDEDEPYGKEAQAYFDANRSDPFPTCTNCGRNEIGT